MGLLKGFLLLRFIGLVFSRGLTLEFFLPMGCNTVKGRKSTDYRTTEFAIFFSGFVFFVFFEKK